MIRNATITDIKPIYDMIKAYFDEGVELRRYPVTWNEERVVIFLGNLLWKTETGLNFISQNNEGVILGEMAETWFGGDKMVLPHVLFVRKEHRNGLIARALLRRFEKEARDKGAVAITWDFWAAITREDTIDGLMTSLGWEYHGAIYRKFLGGKNPCLKL